MHKMLISLMSLAAITAPAFAAEWLTDLEAAKAQASKEGKAILADFTGSDWCGYCIRLKKNVFDKPEFDKYAADKFVLLEIDVPRNPKFSAEQLKRNRELCESYSVSGYPTILVLTSQGDVAGGFVGGLNDTSSVANILTPAAQNAQKLEEAYKLTGEEQLKALSACYKAIPDTVKENAKQLRDKLVALDTNNVTGVQDEVKAEQQLLDFERRVQQSNGDPKKALEIINTLLPEALPANKPMLLDAKFNLQMLTAETLDDIEAAKETLIQLGEVKPELKDMVKAHLEKRFADPAALLEQIKKMRKQQQ